MAKFLITGGCGFVGSHLAKELIKKNHEIRILDDLSTGKLENVPSDVEVIVGTILDQTLLSEALEGIDGCFHLAAIASIERSCKEWIFTHEVNVTGTIKIFDTIASSKRSIPVIFASTAAVYGNQSGSICSETTLPQPLSAYGVDKLASEYHAKIAWNLHKIPNTCLRFFNIYGNGQDNQSPYSGVITRFIKNISDSEPVTIYGDGNQERDFIYIDDVVHFCLRAMDRCKANSETYNVCTGTTTSINELIEILEELLQKKAIKNYEAARIGDIVSSKGDPERALQKLGIKAKHSLKEGLIELLKRASEEAL